MRIDGSAEGDDEPIYGHMIDPTKLLKFIGVIEVKKKTKLLFSFSARKD